VVASDSVVVKVTSNSVLFARAATTWTRVDSKTGFRQLLLLQTLCTIPATHCVSEDVDFRLKECRNKVWLEAVLGGCYAHHSQRTNAYLFIQNA
jgi:hypothetical protein